MTTILPPSFKLPSEEALEESATALGKGITSGIETQMINKFISDLFLEEAKSKEKGTTADILRQKQKLEKIKSQVSPEKAARLAFFDPLARLEVEEKLRASEKGKSESFRGPFASEIKSFSPKIKLSDDQINAIFDSKVIQEIVKKPASQEQILKELRGPRVRSILNFYGSLSEFISGGFWEFLREPKKINEDITRLATDARKLYEGDFAQLENIYNQISGASYFVRDSFVAEKLFGTGKKTTNLPSELDNEKIKNWLLVNKAVLTPISAKAKLIEAFKGKLQTPEKISTDVQKQIAAVWPDRDAENRLAERVVRPTLGSPLEFLEEKIIEGSGQLPKISPPGLSIGVPLGIDFGNKFYDLIFRKKKR